MKLGMISFAHIHAHDYAGCIKQMKDVELSAIYDHDHARGRIAAKQYGVAFYEDLDEFLSQDMDAVIVTSENARHKEYVLKSASAKKHILCEKPIATTIADAKQMIEACNQHQVKLQIAFPVRFCDAIVEAKRIVDQGHLGDIKAILTTNRGRNPGGWFIDSDASGGGAVLDHTVHMVDIVRWFLGKEAAFVSAKIGTMFSDIDIDDAGILNIEFTNGVFMNHDCSWSKNQLYPTWGDVTIELIGTKGHLYVDAFKDHFIAYHDQNQPVRELFAGNDMNLALIEDFVACIRDNKVPSITGWDGLKAMEVALAAYKSAGIQQRVSLQGELDEYN